MGGVRKSRHQSWLAKGLGSVYYVEVLRVFRKRFGRKRPALFKSGQWHFHQGNAPVHNSILFTDHLTKMGIKTVPHLPYSPDLAPCDFCLFPKLWGRRYETIEEMKEAATKVIDTLTQEDFHGAYQKLLERYNECVQCPYEKSQETYLIILVYQIIQTASVKTELAWSIESIYNYFWCFNENLYFSLR